MKIKGRKGGFDRRFILLSIILAIVILGVFFSFNKSLTGRVISESNNGTLTLNILYPVNGESYDSVNSLSFSVSNDSLSSCAYSINDGAENTIDCAQDAVINLTNSGNYTINVFAHGANDSVVSSAVSFSIIAQQQNQTNDSTPPTITINSPTEGQVFETTEVLLNISVADNVGVDSIAYDDGINELFYDEPISLTYANGNYNLNISAVDLAGNEATKSVNFVVDVAQEEEEEETNQESEESESETQTPVEEQLPETTPEEVLEEVLVPIAEQTPEQVPETEESIPETPAPEIEKTRVSLTGRIIEGGKNTFGKAVSLVTKSYNSLATKIFPGKEKYLSYLFVVVIAGFAVFLFFRKYKFVKKQNNTSAA